MSGRDEYNGDGDSDDSWEDASDEEIDIGSEGIIEYLRQELRTTPVGDPAWVEALKGLGYMLFDNYSTTQAMPNLDEAIEIARQVVGAMTDHLERFEALHILGARLGARFAADGRTTDLEEAVHVLQEAANDNRNPEPAGAWCDLGKVFGLKYERTQDLTDLEEAIRVTRLAVAAIPEQHPDWITMMDDLGGHLGNQYAHTGNVRDLEEATELSRQAFNAASVVHPDYPRLLTSLGHRLSKEYSRTGNIASLEEAIQLTRQAVDLVPNDSPHRAMVLSNLGENLGQRYLRNGTMADLEEALQLLATAVSISPDGSPEKASYLNNLGNNLGERYLRIGSVVDLKEGIEYLQQAVDTTPERHPDMAIYMNNLGILLGDRYRRTEAFADLEEAIRTLRRAVTATPQSHVNFPRSLINLSIQLSSQYSRTTDLKVLEEAISRARQAIDCTPESQLDRIAQLDILAVLLGQKHSKTKDVDDLKEAIRVARGAVDATPEGHPYRARVLNNLGEELGNLYLMTKDMVVLEEGIAHLQQAFELMSAETPDRSALLGNLGDQLICRHSKTRAPGDLEKAIGHYQAALRQENSYTLSRIWAGRSILGAASEWQQAYEAASLTVDLVPRLSSRSLRNSDRRHALSQVVGLASDAAAVALQADQGPLAALRLLEQGRGVLGASVEELRADILNLQDKDPELAEQFVRVRAELETGAPPKLPLKGDGAHLDASLRARQLRLYEARKEFDRLVARIQELPEFEDFLLPPSEADIKAAASCGPVIAVNVSQFRCDALLVEMHQVRVLHLTELSKEEIQEKARGGDLGRYEILEWLWHTVAQPILEALGFTTPPPSGNCFPHVWWILTGPMSKFPLHAAGAHQACSAETVIDRVMSSYASSIGALLRGRRRQLRPSAIAGEALLVSMEHTPGIRDTLPLATKEVAVVRDLCASMSLRPVEPGRFIKDVQSRLRACSVFHFAGHGGTDERDASNSRLLLADGALRVAELLEMNLAEHAPFLAYLSACGTGRIRDERSVDESIHLVGAFQLAGFRHVVGTLWEVKDEVCIDVARATYTGIRDGGATDESVCRGLHDALRALRDRDLNEPPTSEDGSPPPELTATGRARDVDAYDAGRLAAWAPYVHFGV